MDPDRTPGFSPDTVVKGSPNGSKNRYDTSPVKRPLMRLSSLPFRSKPIVRASMLTVDVPWWSLASTRSFGLPVTAPEDVVSTSRCTCADPAEYDRRLTIDPSAFRTTSVDPTTVVTCVRQAA